MVLPALIMLKAPAPLSVIVRDPVEVAGFRFTTLSLAPKRKVAAVPEVLSMTTAPSVVAVREVIVCVVPLRFKVAVSEFTNSGLMISPPAAIALLLMASLVVNLIVPRSMSAKTMLWLKFEVAPFVPSVRVPPPFTSIRTPKAVEVVMFPLITVSPGPSSVHERFAVNALAVTPPLKVTALPATTLLMVVTLLAAAAKLRGWLNVRL